MSPCRHQLPGKLGEDGGRKHHGSCGSCSQEGSQGTQGRRWPGRRRRAGRRSAAVWALRQAGWISPVPPCLLRHKRPYLGAVLLHVDAHHHQPAAAELARQLGQVREGGAAGAAPRRPELNHHGPRPGGHRHRVALDEGQPACRAEGGAGGLGESGEAAAAPAGGGARSRCRRPATAAIAARFCGSGTWNALSVGHGFPMSAMSRCLLGGTRVLGRAGCPMRS